MVPSAPIAGEDTASEPPVGNAHFSVMLAPLSVNA